MRRFIGVRNSLAARMVGASALLALLGEDHALEETRLRVDAHHRHAAHERLYTYALPEAPLEIVTLRLAASGQVRRFSLPERGKALGRRRRTTRSVYFAGHGWISCPCLDRDTLGLGSVVRGPAIVEQPDSTTVVLPGQRARADRFGALVVTERADR